MLSVKTKKVKGSGNNVLFSVKSRTLQGAVNWERHLPPAPLPTEYLIAKHRYLGTKLVNILIGKRPRCKCGCVCVCVYVNPP